MTYLWEYLGIPEAEPNRSLLRFLHQESWEFLARSSNPLTDTESVVSEQTELESMLEARPFECVGRVDVLFSVAHRRRWEHFLYHRMPKNTRDATKMPIVRPTAMPITTKSPLWTILQLILRIRQWEHLGGKCWRQNDVTKWAQTIHQLEEYLKGNEETRNTDSI